MKTILITTLAKYQTKFWIEINNNIDKNLVRFVLIAFDDESVDLLKKTNIEFYKINPAINDKFKDNEEIYDYFHSLGIHDVNFWLAHQTYVFKSITKADALRRLYFTFIGVDNIIKNIKSNNIFMVQELGGFTSVVGSYFAALINGVDNIFIEPSFFKGRIFFLKNTFNSIKVKNYINKPNAEVEKYIKSILQNKELAMPKKDVHQFVPVYKKILNANNFVRFLNKLFNKYILRKKYEFDEIILYAIRHIKMLKNHLLLMPYYYSNKSYESTKIIYYPLHVPNDVSLTIRAPDKLDQLSLIELISRVAPDGATILVKEHPAMIGSVDALRLISIIKRQSNVKIINPKVNNIDLLQKANIVVTVNSKAGAEAILLNKDVISLGDSFYSESDFVHRVRDLSLLKDALLIKEGSINRDEKKLINFFSNLWNSSYSGELYFCEDENTKRFSKSLLLSTEL